MKLIIDIPEWKYKSICEGVEASKKCDVVGIDPSVHEAIYNGIPLNSVQEKIAKLPTYMFEIYELKSRVLHILDNIGRADFPQAEDIEPTVKNFSKILDNKLISNAIEEERCCVCGGVKRFGICQDCGSDM